MMQSSEQKHARQAKVVYSDTTPATLAWCRQNGLLQTGMMDKNEELKLSKKCSCLKKKKL